MIITPVILGRGRSGQAIAKSFATLRVLNPEFKIADAVWLDRGTSMRDVRARFENAVLCLANPPGLHAQAIADADAAGFKAVIAEKPVCVNLEQVSILKSIKTPVAVLHVYRQMWGPQTLKKMILEGAFGKLITIEGRYWQSSTAERVIRGDRSKTWKDDPRLSGDSDCYLDVGTHWLDAVSYLIGEPPKQISGWRSFQNALSPHRESHVQVNATYSGGLRAFGSISKTLHGATNHFEVNVIGEKASATWEFLRPDEILFGEGRDRRVITRKDSELGSQQPPHHGMGWLEGYVEITRRLLQEITSGKRTEYPKLGDNLPVLEAMLRTEWR